MADQPTGLYIHWPFCMAKCPYCDFNSHVSSRIDQEQWGDAYCREIDRLAERLPKRHISTIFFGGGTPSLMEPALVARILKRVAQVWPLAPDAEITLEANPTSVESGKFQGYRAAGINRLSLGVQALNDRGLKRLGRLHSASEAIQAFEIARKNFDNISFDLIYARQDQTLADWRDELRRTLELAGNHISLYQLTIEPGTRFAELYKRNRLRGLPHDDVASEMFFETHDVCAKAGYVGYEVSNFAKPQKECKHNLIYWRYQDYIGIGPGAHGRITIDGKKYPTTNVAAPKEWLTKADGALAMQFGAALLDEEQGQEYGLMALRLKEGMNLARYERLAGQKLDPAALKRLSDAGMICMNGDQLHVTETGLPLLDRLLVEML